MWTKSRISTYYYIIKFQKRELSHAHIFIILYFKNRYLNVNEINVIINIEIFNHMRFLNFYIIVIKYIIYNNYNYYVINKTNIISFYWNSNKNEYNKRFLKKFNDYIIFELNIEYFIYRRHKLIMISKDEFK